MRKTAFYLFLHIFLISWLSLNAQTVVPYIGLQKSSFTTATTAPSVRTTATAVTYHEITWTITGGTLSACQVQVDSSSDNVSWNSADVITSQLCTSNGSSSAVNFVANYIRVHVTSITANTGTPVLNVVWTGYANNPSGGGAVGPGTQNALAKFATTTTVGNSLFTDDGTSGAYSGSGGFNATGPISTGTKPTACGSATGCFAAAGASTASTQTASQGSFRLDSVYWKYRHVNGTNEVSLGTAYTATGSGAIGALDATNGPAQIIICTATCSLTPLSPPALGYQLCVVLKAGVTGTITLNALGNSAQYGKTDGSAFGTAGTGTMVSTSTTGNRVCIVGSSATTYETPAFQGTFTNN